MGNPGHGGFQWYQFVESDEFHADAAAEFGDSRLWDDIRRLLEEDIVRNPGLFPALKPGYHWATTNTIPPRLIMFRIDEVARRVHYLAVRRGGYG